MDLEKSPPRKILKTTQPSEKLCVVCARSGSGGDDDFGLQIFFVDLDGAGNTEPIPTAPALIIDRKCLLAHSSCLIYSTLYLFGYTENMDFMSVYTYELPPNISDFHCKRLETRDLRRIPDMNYYKRHPITIPSPDNKYVLAFSYDIPTYLGPDSEYFDFEMYDHRAEEWIELPNIPPEWRCVPSGESFCSITGYSFINDHTFLLQTGEIGDFTLDLSSPTGWRKIPEDEAPEDCSSDVPSLGGGYGRSVYVKDNVFLAGNCVVDEGYVFHYPDLPQTVHYDIIKNQGPVTVLDADRAGRGIWKFCIALTEIDRAGFYPQLTLHVCLLDLPKYKEAKKKMEEGGILKSTPLPASSTIKTFKFCFDDREVLPEYFAAEAMSVLKL